MNVQIFHRSGSSTAWLLGLALSSLCLLSASFAIAQEMSMDLRVVAAPSAGSVFVELFPAQRETAAVEVTVSTEGGADQTYRADGKAVTISGLVPGRTYTVKAKGFSAQGIATEISPPETVVAR